MVRNGIRKEGVQLAGRQKRTAGGLVEMPLGELYPKQWAFFESKTRYTGYGGARGGGKTHVVLRKAVSGCLEYPGIKVLILRRSYPELEATLILPFKKLIRSATRNGRPCGDLIATYNVSMRMMFFANGSIVKFGHLQNQAGLDEYQGQEYDWIFMDEGTHFTEYEFRAIGATLRGVNDIPKHFYVTCNPGGVGHQWVKRLFITRDYDKSKGEDGRDYSFIRATVEDNRELMKCSKEYVQMLDALPEELRAAWRYGDWDAMAGQYFSEFKPERHVVPPFAPPRSWPKYRCFDYGLDMFACYWFAVDFDGRVWVYREYCEGGLIVSEAARAMALRTPAEEQIEYTIAPPDMWSTLKDTGRTMAGIFSENGIGLVRAGNRRVQGWMAVKEFLKERCDGRPGLLITADCARLIRDLPALQRDPDNPSDAATEPHGITHAPDALRYGLVYRTMEAADARMGEDGGEEDYSRVMRGGDPSKSYLRYGG